MTTDETSAAPASEVKESRFRRIRFRWRDQRVLFVLVGGLNTVIGFVVFVSLDMSLGRVVDSAINTTVGSIATLSVSQMISVMIAFVLHRKLVFRVRGHVWLDLLRFQGVYVVTFLVNLALLPLLVALEVPRIGAQAGIVAAMTVLSYMAHRHFSFRRQPDGEPQDKDDNPPPAGD